MAFFQTESLWVNELADGVAVLMLDVPGSKRNHLNPDVLVDLDKALAVVEKEDRFRLLILRSGKENHFATGPSLEEVTALKTADDFAALAQQGQELYDRLTRLTIPSVSLIAGSCQDGGLELSLACDYRVVVDNSKTRLGFGDLEIGWMPAWGGTQRLPAIVGLERALQILLGEKQLSAEMALAWGLADALVQKNDDQRPDFLDQPQKRSRGKLPFRTWRQWLTESMGGGRWLIYRGMERWLKRRVPDDLPTPWEILHAVRKGIEEGNPAGLEAERASLARVGQSQAFQNLLHWQNARHQVCQVDSKPDQGSPFQKIGIVGVGARGSQLAFWAISRGCQVVLREAEETALGKSLFQILGLFQQGVEQGTMERSELPKNLAAITGTTVWKGFQDLKMALEMVGTGWDDLGTLFQEMEAQTGPDTLLVATSGLKTLEELRYGLKNPSRLVGLHFVVPVGGGSVVEVVKGETIDSHTIQKLQEWVIHLAGLPIVVRDRPGLLVQRIWMSAIHEAILLLQQGLPLIRIEEAMRRFGMSRGPLELADLLGVIRLQFLVSAFPEHFGRIETLLDEMKERGWFGKQVGKGFYQYHKRRARLNSGIEFLARQTKDSFFRDVGSLSHGHQLLLIQKRIVARTINEAAWCLEEGIVDGEGTLDLAMASAGWAPHRGGPMAYARQLGIETVLQQVERLAEEHGPDFLPCPALAKLRKT
jgi:3-hydroxyacyl-CoA dehydrogenase/enoyl-CoA hydratase/3-hydroxybutyryl-CoA epimerase